MKKIFTLISVALLAISANAQTTPEVWDASSLKDETAMKNQDSDPQHDWAVVKAAAIEKTVNTAKNVIIHDPADVLPWPGKHEKLDENGNVVYEKDENGNPTTTPVYEPNVTDPTTVTNNGSDQLYNYTIKGSTENVEMTAIGTPNLGETNNWTFGLGVDPTAEVTNNKSLYTDACDPKFMDYIKMKSGNCTEQYYDWYEYNEDGDVVHKTANDKWDPACGVKPAIGSWYEFKVKANGTLKIGFFIPKNIQNNKLYFAEVQEDQFHFTLLDPSKLTVWGWINNNTFAEDNENCIRNSQPRADYCVIQAENLQNPFLGYISFTAEAGKTYMFVSPETQLGIYGFQFTAGSGESGITNTIKSETDAAAPAYNLNGQRVDGSYKGVVIQNGKKRVQ